MAPCGTTEDENESSVIPAKERRPDGSKPGPNCRGGSVSRQAGGSQNHRVRPLSHTGWATAVARRCDGEARSVTGAGFSADGGCMLVISGRSV
jgi:hypothetical protein